MNPTNSIKTKMPNQKPNESNQLNQNKNAEPNEMNLTNSIKTKMPNQTK